MTRYPGPSAAAQDQGGFAREFVAADGQRVMVAAFTPQQFADLATATSLVRTFAFLERALSADFSTCADLYSHRGAIAVLLSPWVSRRTVADLAAAFTGTSVTWGTVCSDGGLIAEGEADDRSSRPPRIIQCRSPAV